MIITLQQTGVMMQVANLENKSRYCRGLGDDVFSPYTEQILLK